MNERSTVKKIQKRRKQIFQNQKFFFEKLSTFFHFLFSSSSLGISIGEKHVNNREDEDFNFPKNEESKIGKKERILNHYH